MNNKQYRLIFILFVILAVGFCMVFIVATMSGSAILLLGLNQTAEPLPRPRSTTILLDISTTTPTATAITTPTTVATPTPTMTATSTTPPTDTATPSPTETETPTPLPPSPTSSPTPPPPTDTPTPTFSFVIAETEHFSTNHPNFDVYTAVTDSDNKPLSGYRVQGYHSGGMQVESRVSADRWTDNSGANQYKAGNIKYEVFNSPGGVWRLQLIDDGGKPVAPAIEFPFDPSNPTWYFILYQKIE